MGVVLQKEQKPKEIYVHLNSIGNVLVDTCNGLLKYDLPL